MDQPKFYYTILAPCAEHSFSEKSDIRFVFNLESEKIWFERSFSRCKTRTDVAELLISLGDEIYSSVMESRGEDKQKG